MSDHRACRRRILYRNDPHCQAALCQAEARLLFRRRTDAGRDSNIRHFCAVTADIQRHRGACLDHTARGRVCAHNAVHRNIRGLFGLDEQRQVQRTQLFPCSIFVPARKFRNGHHFNALAHFCHNAGSLFHLARRTGILVHDLSHRRLIVKYFFFFQYKAAVRRVVFHVCPARTDQVRQFHIFFHVKQAVFGSAEHPVDRNGGAYHHRQCQERNIKQCVMPSLLFACLLMRHSFLLGGRLRMICGLRCGGKLRKPFRLVRQLQLSTGICVRLSGVLRILRSDGDLFRQRGILFAFGSLPGLYVRSLFNFRSIRLCSCFPWRFFFRLRRSGPTSVILRRIAAAFCFRSAAGHAQSLPGQSIVFRCRHLCAFPFCSCFRVLRCLEEGLHAVRLLDFFLRRFLSGSCCRRLYVSVFRVFCRFAFLFCLPS